MNQFNVQAQDVDLASAGERIGAVLLNWLFNLLAFIPIVWAILSVLPSAEQLDQMAFHPEEMQELVLAILSSTFFQIACALWLVYAIWQIVMMSKYGQSLGKRCLNLKVIKSNGEEAGFVGVVLLREVVYTFILTVVGVMIEIAFSMQEGAAANILSVLLSLVCLVMLFVQKDRRTVQDFLANTVVVKLPKTKETARFSVRTKE